MPSENRNTEGDDEAIGAEVVTAVVDVVRRVKAGEHVDALELLAARAVLRSEL